MFHQTAFEPSLGHRRVLKVILWVLYSSAFLYTIAHVPGELSTMADMVPTAPPGTLTRPPPAYIISVQRSTSDHPAYAAPGADILICMKNKLRVPPHGEDLKSSRSLLYMPVRRATVQATSQLLYFGNNSSVLNFIMKQAAFF